MIFFSTLSMSMSKSEMEINKKVKFKIVQNAGNSTQVVKWLDAN